MSKPVSLGRLMDAQTIMAELGVKRAGAEAIMGQLPAVQIPGFRKRYVRRADVEQFIEEHTVPLDPSRVTSA